MLGDSTKIHRAWQTLRKEGPGTLLQASIRAGIYNTRLFRAEIAYRRAISTVRYGRAGADPYTILWIDPNAIDYWRPNHNKYHLPSHNLYQGSSDGFLIDIWADAGSVVGGEWDQREYLVPFEDTPKYQGVRAHFEEGVPWEQTELFDILLTIMEQRPMIDGCTTEADLHEQYEEVDRLYERISKNGYRRRTELEGMNGLRDILNEIGVVIDRDGNFLFLGSGWHRLSIAKILDIDLVPVRVVLRHKRWQDIRTELAACEDIENLTARTSKHLPHPDLRDLHSTTDTQPNAVQASTDG